MKTTTVDYEAFRLESCNKFREIRVMTYGKERRTQLHYNQPHPASAGLFIYPYP